VSLIQDFIDMIEEIILGKLVQATEGVLMQLLSPSADFLADDLSTDQHRHREDGMIGHQHCSALPTIDMMGVALAIGLSFGLG
jgi:hypothetical protein